MKARVLAIARGDDHNDNINHVLSGGLQQQIESYIRATKCVNLNGRSVPVRISTCLDFVASRNMANRRSNAPVHSLTLCFGSIPEAPADATWKQVESLLQKKAPWAVWNEAKPMNHRPTQYPWKCHVPGCKYSVENEAEQADNEAILQTLRKGKSQKTKAQLSKLTAAFCDTHDQFMEFRDPALCVHPRDNIGDFLHGIDINLCEKWFYFSFHDPVLLAGSPDLKGALSDFYTAIGCPLDLTRDVGGGRRWFHGAVWRYDFVIGANRKSFGLDVNVLIMCLICFGAKEGDASPQQKAAATIVNDLPLKRPASKKKRDPVADPVMQILTALFGQNATKVRAIFVTSNAYAALFSTHSQEWKSTDT